MVRNSREFMDASYNVLGHDKQCNFYGNADHATLQQFFDVLKQDNVIGAALMADAHLGYTMPIGGVALTKDALYPAWVGYDIGCGVCAIPILGDLTDMYYYFTDESQKIYEQIKGAIPSKEHKHCIASLPNQGSLSPGVRHLVSERSAYKQIGTIGSGNHFLEIAVDDDGQCWIVIHSGSRGIGHGIAGYWMERADELAPGGMGCFERGSESFDRYFMDQKWCCEYALTNRVTMLKILEETLGISLDWDRLINKVHNTVELYATNGMYVHRKGATSAKEGEFGVIPGNMRDGSVIVKGLGNPLSYDSCSHGAGRLYSRGKAKRELSLETFSEDMEGITCSVSPSSLDECPAAYKDFNGVLDAQKDLCKVVKRLKPIINLKG